jgi:hypothetical protein
MQKLFQKHKEKEEGRVGGQKLQINLTLAFFEKVPKKGRTK